MLAVVGNAGFVAEIITSHWNEITIEKCRHRSNSGTARGSPQRAGIGST